MIIIKIVNVAATPVFGNGSGATVSSGVGIGVGVGVGVAVGVGVGVGVGSDIGSMEGVAVGSGVGSAVGAGVSSARVTVMAATVSGDGMAVGANAKTLAHCPPKTAVPERIPVVNNAIRYRRIRFFVLAAGAPCPPPPNSGGGGELCAPGVENSSGRGENSRSRSVMGIAVYLLCTSTWGKGHSTPRDRKPSHRSRFRMRAPE